MKKRTAVLLLLMAVLLIGLGGCAVQKNAPGEAAAAYLEELKANLDGANAGPMEVDPENGRIIAVHVDSAEMTGRIQSYLANAAEVRQVKAIPELEPPLVYIGDQMMGNHEKLYYSEGTRIYAFSLNDTDALGFLLTLTGQGAMYPQVKEAFTEGVIRQLQDTIVYGEADAVTLSNGVVEQIDIKTHETAEMLFQCIRNCAGITDLTGMSLQPMELPVCVNGKEIGTFEALYIDYAETGQFLCIAFSQADSQSFRDYVTALAQTD